jgi:putative RNA 2'-phosphotransferase
LVAHTLPAFAGAAQGGCDGAARESGQGARRIARRRLMSVAVPARGNEVNENMSMTKDSKFLSLVLRHRPDSIGLTLCAEGWAEIDALPAAAARAGHALTLERLEAIVETSAKKRFSISADGARIRAAQGHSVEVALGHAPSVPPEGLFLGTAQAHLPAVLAEGLRPGRRRQVHLCADADMAATAGRRHGPPAVLRVAAGRMHRDGLSLFMADNGVWLTDAVAPTYLTVD